MAKKSIYKIEQERVVTNAVLDDARSIQSIADVTGLNYYTVRRLVEDLTKRGILKLYGMQDKARLYIYNLDNTERHDYLPRVSNVLTKSNEKITAFLGAADNIEEAQAIKAIYNVPLLIARLLDAANRASLGHQVGKDLEQLIRDMQQAEINIRNTAYALQQILEEPRLWEAKYLAEMVQDDAFNIVEIHRVLNLYERRSEMERQAKLLRESAKDIDR